MSAQNDQDLLPEQTAGFKVGEKKTMDQINQLGMHQYWFMMLCSTDKALTKVLLFFKLTLNNIWLHVHSMMNSFKPFNVLKALSCLPRI